MIKPNAIRLYKMVEKSIVRPRKRLIFFVYFVLNNQNKTGIKIIEKKNIFKYGKKYF